MSRKRKSILFLEPTNRSEAARLAERITPYCRTNNLQPPRKIIARTEADTRSIKQLIKSASRQYQQKFPVVVFISINMQERPQNALLLSVAGTLSNSGMIEMVTFEQKNKDIEYTHLPKYEPDTLFAAACQMLNCQSHM